MGSGGSAVSATRACPCMLIDDQTVFDLGSGSLKNLITSKIDTNRLSKVFISHCHADHITDLIAFLWTIQISGRTTSLDLYGPLGFRRIFDMLLTCTSTPEGFFKFPLTIRELNYGDRVENIQTCKASHSIPTLAFRVESQDGTFCYSADTVHSPEIVSLAKDVDLLLHEATFLEDQVQIADLTRHSTARSAGLTAREAEAKKLVLFHIPPPNDHREQEFQNEASSAYGGNVEIGHDLTSFKF
ncbi:MAG TPA: MBL fold metallo-hydrolase [Candidatus Acidoferrum sp.]|nr:MBL fold metallo-hydrolase [Candidatus Acidoferrum sp.]